MLVRIFKKSRKSTQSGSHNQSWILEFEKKDPSGVEPLMGYFSSSYPQRRLVFRTSNEAIDYAKRNNLIFRIEPVQEVNRPRICYAENFSYNRKTPWTH